MKKLTKDGIISQYRVLLDLNKTWHLLYKIMLRLRNLSSKKEEEFRAFVKNNSTGVQFLKLLGNWDIEMEFEVENEEQLHDILLEIRNQFSEVIKDYDTLLIRKEHKLNYYPF